MRKALTYGLEKKYFSDWFSKADADLYMWALALNPGDVYHACDGWNHILAKTEVSKRPCYTNRHGFIIDIQLTAIDGHTGDLDNCVWYHATPNEITTYWKDWLDNRLVQAEIFWPKLTAKLKQAFTDGNPICDDKGCKII